LNKEVFFFEKRTKKLLLVRLALGPLADVMPAATGKSFLVLFFKKEHFLIPCLA